MFRLFLTLAYRQNYLYVSPTKWQIYTCLVSLQNKRVKTAAQSAIPACGGHCTELD